MRTSPRCAGTTRAGAQCLRSENCPKHREVNARAKTQRNALKLKAAAKHFMRTNGGAELPLEYTPLTKAQIRKLVNQGHIEACGRPYYTEEV